MPVKRVRAYKDDYVERALLEKMRAHQVGVALENAKAALETARRKVLAAEREARLLRIEVLLMSSAIAVLAVAMKMGWL